MSHSGRAVMRMRILGGRAEIPLASVSRRALRDGTPALSSRASITTRIGPTVVNAFAGSRINFVNCSVAERVVQRERFPLTILPKEIFQSWSRSAMSNAIVLRRLLGRRLAWSARSKQYDPSRFCWSNNFAMVCAMADFPDPATPVNRKMRGMSSPLGLLTHWMISLMIILRVPGRHALSGSKRAPLA